MDAYELADILQEYYDDFDGSFPALEKSIVMLRQQADRIAELEKCLFQMQNACVYLTKPSAEPFIWLKQDFDGEWIEVHPNKGIPLYTTPQIKQLSDEEILNLYKETEADNGGIREFARAILKKANEK